MRKRPVCNDCYHDNAPAAMETNEICSVNERNEPIRTRNENTHPGSSAGKDATSAKRGKTCSQCQARELLILGLADWTSLDREKKLQISRCAIFLFQPESLILRTCHMLTFMKMGNLNNLPRSRNAMLQLRSSNYAVSCADDGYFLWMVTFLWFGRENKLYFKIQARFILLTLR